VYGQVSETTSINLASGWNLAGYPSQAPHTVLDALSGVPFNLAYAYHASDADPWKLYDRNGPPFVNDLNELAPGWGYWIQVTAPASWTVTYAGP
jgi:hypothetical protein